MHKFISTFVFMLPFALAMLVASSYAQNMSSDLLAVTTPVPESDSLSWHSDSFREAMKFVTDPRDGRRYKIVQIGSQTWMAENLNYATPNSYCYKDVSDSCTKYGRLYTWAAAMDSAEILRTSGYECGYDRKCPLIRQVQGVCPDGWHLPMQNEWLDLIKKVGGASIANKVLKSKTGWLGIGNGTDDFGFAVLPAGDKDLDDRFLIGNDAAFWSSTGDGTLDAYYMGLEHNKVDVKSISKARGFSVRCIKNVDGGESGRSPLSFRSNPHGEPQKGREYWRRPVQPDSVIVGSFKDSRDGQTYGTVTIGSQTWMSENLNYDIGDSYCSDKDNSCNKYRGCCYKWEDANDVCPVGWRLPTEADWDTLFESVGGKNTAGYVLRSRNGWTANEWLYNEWFYRNGSDDYGFTMIPTFDSKAKFWISSERYFMNFSNYLSTCCNIGNIDKRKAEYEKVSVRCIKGNGNSNSHSKSKIRRKKKARSSADFPPSKVVKDTFVDFRDGQTYKTVTIGKQTWFAQNLNYITPDSYCYEDNVNNCAKYGRLYKKEIAKNACPNGWHLSTTDEWKSLVNAVGGSSVARLKLKATEGWYNNNGTDDYGFSVLPAGKRDGGGGYDGGRIESFFITCCYDDVKFDYVYTYDIFNSPYSRFYDGGNAYSVRCVKNNGETIESSSSKASASSSSKH